MSGVSRRSLAGSLLAATALLLCAFSPSPAAAARLAVRLVGGQGYAYELADIQDVDFAGDTLQVVTAASTDAYELGRIFQIDLGLDAWTGVEDLDLADGVTRALHLFQNQPNPFSPETRIAYELSQGGRAQVRLYSVNGRLVRTLLDEERPAGRHSLAWDGLDESGRAVPSGVYFYALAALGVEESRKWMLARKDSSTSTASTAKLSSTVRGACIYRSRANLYYGTGQSCVSWTSPVGSYSGAPVSGLPLTHRSEAGPW